MRQNPITARLQVGGRSMPSWFSASLVGDGSGRSSSGIAPPLPNTAPPSSTQDESEYEEIDHLPRYSNAQLKKPTAIKRSCSLCGNGNPVVQCEMCNNQIFCGSCNDMYHRHPKRHNHLRKLLETFENRPPLPPKTIAPPDAPVPPPRRLKKFGIRSATSSPTSFRKVFFDPMGSLKRQFSNGMEQRPLPPPPKPAPPLPPKSTDPSRNIFNDRRHNQHSALPASQHFGQSSPALNRNIPMTVMELANSSRRNDMSHQDMMRSAWDDRNLQDDRHIDLIRPRAQSISTSQLNRFNSSSNISHIATLQRKPKRPIVCGPVRPPPPPIPPREFPPATPNHSFNQHHQHPHSVHSASAFNLNQMEDPQMMMPWMQSYPFGYPQQQQQHPMFYPGSSMKRTPSASSMTGSNQPVFNPWSTIRLGNQAQDHQGLTASERELQMISDRRGSEPPPLPPYGNQMRSMSSLNQAHPSNRNNFPDVNRHDSEDHPLQNFHSTNRQLRQDSNRENLHDTPRQHFQDPNRPHFHDAQHRQHFQNSGRTNFPDSNRSNFQDSNRSSFQDSNRSNFQDPNRSNIQDPHNFSRDFPSDRERSMSPFIRPINDSKHRMSDAEGSQPPEGYWSCEWCTLINSNEVTICSACCKTTTASAGENPPVSSSKNLSNGNINSSNSSSGTNNKGKRGKSPVPKKPSSSFIRSTLSFSRNEKSNKTSARVEKQILKLEACSDEDLPGDSTSSSDESPETRRRESFRQAHHHHKRLPKSKTPLMSSNEQVYGSISLQSLTLTPRDIKEPVVKVSTGVGSSPPKYSEAQDGSSSAQEEDSPHEKLESVRKVEKSLKDIKPVLKKSTEASTRSDVSTRIDASTMRTDASTRIDGTTKTGIIEAATRTDVSTKAEVSARNEPLVVVDEPLVTKIEVNLKSSKGTSPPPQSISTQTYEELPSPRLLESKTGSKSSIIASGMELDEPMVRKVKEMSDKELRYTRKAQQQSKLKRSMSTHLTSSGADPWIEANEGRHLYRSSSRHSLASDTRSLPISGPPSREVSPPRRFYHQDLRAFGPPSWDRYPSPADYFASIEDLVTRRRKDSSRNQEFELTRLLKEAVETGFAPEDVQVALRMCGDRNPIKWLQDNWINMVETVQTLATKYGREKGDERNEVGTISTLEAKEALRLHRGNVWVAVTECVEQRRKKFQELQSRGNFLREDILTALTANYGKLDAAYVELSKAQLKPFLMQIWGPPIGLDNEAAPTPSALSTAENSPPALIDSSKHFDDIDLILEANGNDNVDAIVNIEEDETPIRFEGKRASIEDDPFLDAAEEAILEESLQREKDVIEASSDLEESEAFVSDLLQNFQIPLTSVQQASSPDQKILHINDVNKGHVVNKDVGEANTLQPQEQLGPHKLERQKLDLLDLQPQQQKPSSLPIESHNSQPQAPNFVEEPKVETVKSPNEKPEQDQTITPANIHTLSNALKMSPGGDGTGHSKINFSMEAVLELLEQQRVNMLKQQQQLSSSLMEITTMNSSSQSQKHQMNGSPRASKLQDETLQQEVAAVGITETDVQAEDNAEIYQDLESELLSIIPESIINVQKTTLITVEGISRGEVPLIGGMDNQVRKPLLQAQTSVDSGDIDLDPSIYEEVDSGSMTEYLTNNQVSDDESDEAVETSSGEEVEEEDLEEASSDASIQSQTEETDEDDLVEVYEKIAPPSEEPTSVIIPEPTAIQSQPTVSEVQEGAFKNIKPEIKRLLESGLSDSFECAELAVQLMDMKFTEEDSIHAAKECGSIYSALSYLQQECLLCAGKFSAMQMISMLRCTHWCCKGCARDYFQVQVRDQGILDATCPFCKEPSNLLEDPDAAAEYFNHLDILLKNLLEDKHHEMFQRKLRDWALSKTPNFKWCSKCSSGFITEPLQTRLVCPDCSAVTCAVCLEPWDRTHDHRGQNLVKLCDTDATKNIVDYLNENCIECPRCRLKFALARGGCMHLTCSQCKFEFCSGCSAPFRLATKCNDGPFCLKLGLHAHHPRNCLFYLRDKEAPFLAQLLEDNAIPYLSEEVIVDAETEKRKCQVSIQRETEAGLQDEVCGNDAPPGFANVCQAHYIEYLGLLIWQNHLDPISILSNDDLETIIKRAHKKVPSRPYGTKDIDFRTKLLKVITDEIPL